jgi:polysaccharide export outer membrane protein
LTLSGPESENGLAMSTLVLLLFLLQAADPSAYQIGPDDLIHVTVIGQAEMTGDFPVDREGMLVFPILGKVKASGLAAGELERKLTTLLADGYVKRPQVSVSVRDYRSQKVFVTGQVGRPGAYALRADRTVRAVLGDAGNLASDAGHEVVVIRPHHPSPDAPADATPVSDPATVPDAEVFRISVRDIQAATVASEFVLQAGDTVNVPRAALVFVNGHVARQGSYRFEEGLTVLQAITLAGGLTERGSNKRIKLVRTVDGKPAEIKAKLTDALEPGDTILVPERFF